MSRAQGRCHGHSVTPLRSLVCRLTQGVDRRIGCRGWNLAGRDPPRPLAGAMLQRKHRGTAGCLWDRTFHGPFADKCPATVEPVICPRPLHRIQVGPPANAENATTSHRFPDPAKIFTTRKVLLISAVYCKLVISASVPFRGFSELRVPGLSAEIGDSDPRQPGVVATFVLAGTRSNAPGRWPYRNRLCGRVACEHIRVQPHPPPFPVLRARPSLHPPSSIVRALLSLLMLVLSFVIAAEQS